MNGKMSCVVGSCVLAVSVSAGCVEEPPEAVGCYVGRSTSSIKAYVDGELVTDENDSGSNEDLELEESFSEDFRVDAGGDCFLEANFEGAAAFTFIPRSCPAQAGELGTVDLYYSGGGELRADDEVFMRYDYVGEKTVDGREVEFVGWIEFLGERLQKCY